MELRNIGFFSVVLVVLGIPSGISQQCRSYNRQAGNCVSIKTCPPLLTILKNNPSQAELRQLQKLTCGFDSMDPKVCCPLNDIVIAEQSSFPNQNQAPIPSKQGETDNANGGTEFKGHKNFNQIPGVKDCGVGLQQNRIIGGKNVSHGVYPWMARIGYMNTQLNAIDYYCGGTIISKRYILTAAHCTEGTGEFAPAEVKLGEHDINSDMDCNNDIQKCSKSQDFKIEKIITHKMYSSVTKQNDISLIRLASDIDFSTYFIKPVCLPFFKDYEVGSMEAIDRGIVAGWGRVQWNKAEGSSILQEVTLPIKSNEACQSVYSKRVAITSQQLCAGGVAGQDSCGGDSGGPILAPLAVNKIPRMFQLGIVSFGPVQCGVGGLPGVYARTSSYLGWILDNME